MENRDLENRISIYTADASALNDDGLFERIYASASSARREKIDRLRFRSDKNLSLCAEYLFMYACTDHGIDLQREEIVLSEHSKPQFAHSGIRFNLSHSGERAMCVMSDVPDLEVGCDVERLHGYKPKIAKRFYTEEEKTLLAQCPSDDEREEMFYRIWTLKESFMKCTGLGMSLPMEAFSVTDGTAWKPVIKDSSFTACQDREYAMLEYGRDDGYRYAVCVQNGFICMQEGTESECCTSEGVIVCKRNAY